MNVSPALVSNPIEASTIRKLRTRIIPAVFVLFVINYIDRINIGFAALTMNKELAISSQQYGFIAGVFFFGYFIFEIPSNLLLHKLGARVWLARILVTWGIVAILTGFARTATHLYILRFLLGLAEAGYFPGIVLYLTYWFGQKRLAHAVALLCCGSAIANIVGAPISGVILDHIHWFAISSWRWLLILEGIPAIVGGIITYCLLPSRPAQAKFLTSEEKDWILAELAHEEQQKLTTGHATVGHALMSRRVWHLTAIYFFVCLTFNSMIFWMPQLIKALSSQYSNTKVGILVMIPYVCAVVGTAVVSHRSDRTLERRYHAAVPAIVAGLSLILLGAAGTVPLSAYVAFWCVIAPGVYSIYGPYWSLPNEFLTGCSAAAGIALINSLGNLSGFVGPYALGAIYKRTGSFRGGLVFAGISMFIAAVLILALRKRTEQKVISEAAIATLSPVAVPTGDVD